VSWEWGIVKAKRRALAERRGVMGHSQEKLAEIVGVELSTVGRWERGETSPQPWCRPTLADALTVSLEELDSMLAEGQPVEDPEQDRVLSAPWSHRGAVEAAVELKGGDRPVKRRHFAFLTGAALTAPAHQWLVHDPGPLVSGLAGRRVSMQLADRFLAMLGELRMMDDVAGGGTVLSPAEQQFGMVADLLGQASYDEPTGRKLHIALAELGQFAGWTACDAGQQSVAQRYYIAALRATHSADDRPLGAYILGCMAYQAIYQAQPAEAVTLVETALAGARGRGTASLLAQLYSKQADAFATLRDASGCTTAISKARTHIERLQQDDDPPWLYWIGPAEVTANAGHCLLKLGQADRAAAMLDEGIALFDKSFVRDRTHHLLRLADALTRPGAQRDLDAAAARGMAVLGLAESLDSGRHNDLLHGLCHQMRPHAKLPAVADFLNRAQGLVQA
jgi:transcriptional regulator with XRE-family HTH domain